MNWEISIDFGNIWEMLSALGTIGAVIYSLWLTWRSNKKNSEPIQGKMMYSKHAYMGLSKGHVFGDLIEGTDHKKAVTIRFNGRMRFYNPSDEPKSLTELKIVVKYRYQGENLIHTLPILKKQNEYISLSPKETKIINYEVFQNIDDFSKDQIEFFYQVYDYELQGANEDLEAQVFKLTVKDLD